MLKPANPTNLKPFTIKYKWQPNHLMIKGSIIFNDQVIFTFEKEARYKPFYESIVSALNAVSKVPAKPVETKPEAQC